MAEDRLTDSGRCLDIFPPAHLPNSNHISFGKVHIQELPSELVEGIIRFVLEEFPDLERLPLVDRSHHPRLQVTQICARWRAIAFSMDDLWELAVSEDGYSPALRSLISSWLRQISGSRLSLKLSWVGGDRKSPLEDFIIPYCQRFKKLSVHLSPTELGELLGLPEYSFNNLVTLHVLLVGSQPLDFRVASSSFITAPFLRELVLISDWGFHLTTLFPWVQLTTLSVLSRHIDAVDCLSVLCNGISLVDLSLSLIFDIDSETTTRISALRSHPLCLPNVKKLSLVFRCANPGPFLLFLELPNLIHLTLGCHKVAHWERLIHRQFFKAFAHRLEYFETQNDLMFVEMRDEFLTWMPNLRSLTLRSDYRLTSTALERIGTGELLPRAESLEFCTRDFALVVKMLSERWRNAQLPGSSVVAIKKIKVYARTWSVDDEYWKLRARGVEINLARI